MALLITEECISCQACEVECPNDAIYAAGDNWVLGGKEYDPISLEHTFIAYDKCTECVGYYDEPQCLSACPTEAIIKDPERVETIEQLLAKKENIEKLGK